MRNGENFSEQDLNEAEKIIGYKFADGELLKTCLTHKSYANAKGGEHNERLEFLGDSVLQLCVTEELYKNNFASEGALTNLRKQLVSKEALEAACKKAGLMQFMRYSGGEDNIGGKTPSNLFEAVIAAIYLDGGMEEVRRFLQRYLEFTAIEDYKTQLQEYAQKRTKELPVYGKPKEINGKFYCAVSALGQSAEGEGESEELAKKAAAKALYLFLKGGERD